VTSLAAPVCRPLLAIAHERSAVAAVSCWRHNSHHGDPAFCTDHTAFSAPPTAKAPEPLAVPQNKANTGSVASQPRLFLPKDLAGALKRLDTAEIDALLAAVTTEAERRGQLPPTRAKEKPTADARPQPR
jgi:hypothetical protein